MIKSVHAQQESVKAEAHRIALAALLVRSLITCRHHFLKRSEWCDDRSAAYGTCPTRCPPRMLAVDQMLASACDFAAKLRAEAL